MMLTDLMILAYFERVFPLLIPFWNDMMAIYEDNEGTARCSTILNYLVLLTFLVFLFEVMFHFNFLIYYFKYIFDKIFYNYF